MYTERKGRFYEKHEANLREVNKTKLKQSYQKSKSFLSLQHRVVAAEQIEDGKLLPYKCVLYIQNSSKEVSANSVQPHGNSTTPESVRAALLSN